MTKDWMADEELKGRLLKAESAEEVAQMLREGGYEFSPEDARCVYEKAVARRSNEEEFSLEELEAVAGGVRDYYTEGCAATVEAGSWCWSNDRCGTWDVVYNVYPIDRTCKACGGGMLFVNRYDCYKCSKCGLVEW